MYDYGIMGWGWMILALATLLLFLIGAIVIAFILRGNKNPKDQTAEELLKIRLAKGEISEEEFDRLIKKVK